VSTSGVLERFALWRTLVIGFFSVHSQRMAWENKALMMFRIFALLPRANGSDFSHASTSTAFKSDRRKERQRGRIQELM